jgi:hypothetical protein
MIKAVKEVGNTIKECKFLGVHPSLYYVAMDTPGFILEAMMVVLSYLLDNKA